MHVSNNRCIDPTALARMQPRSQVIDRVNRKAPPPSLPSRFSSGTSQFSKNTSAIGDVRTPIFSSLRATFIPGESFSTRNALSPSGPRVLSTVANTTSTSATGPLVTKILLPLRMYAGSFLDGGRSEAECVGAAIRFAHGVAADERAVTKAGQIFFLLRFGAVVDERNDRRPHMRVDGEEQAVVLASVPEPLEGAPRW